VNTGSIVRSRPLAYRSRNPAVVSRNMSAIRATENQTEVALRRALHTRGLRFRKYAAGLPGRPDIIFRVEKVAVFVDGDYWHARILREKGLAALKARHRTSTRDYWIQKFQRRVKRDEAVNTQLRLLGWCVLRFWESDIRRDVEPAARKVESVVRRRRRALGRR